MVKEYFIATIKHCWPKSVLYELKYAFFFDFVHIWFIVTYFGSCMAEANQHWPINRWEPFHCRVCRPFQSRHLLFSIDKHHEEK